MHTSITLGSRFERVKHSILSRKQESSEWP